MQDIYVTDSTMEINVKDIKLRTNKIIEPTYPPK